MIKELMAAITTHGKPLRFFIDNGACYASHHLKFACANLGIHLIHSPPGMTPNSAQRLEKDSLWDFSSLLFQTAKPSKSSPLRPGASGGP